MPMELSNILLFLIEDRGRLWEGINISTQPSGCRTHTHTHKIFNDYIVRITKLTDSSQCFEPETCTIKMMYKFWISHSLVNLNQFKKMFWRGWKNHQKLKLF